METGAGDACGDIPCSAQRILSNSFFGATSYVANDSETRFRKKIQPVLCAIKMSDDQTALTGTVSGHLYSWKVSCQSTGQQWLWPVCVCQPKLPAPVLTITVVACLALVIYRPAINAIFVTNRISSQAQSFYCMWAISGGCHAANIFCGLLCVANGVRAEYITCKIPPTTNAYHVNQGSLVSKHQVYECLVFSFCATNANGTNTLVIAFTSPPPCTAND